MKPLPKKEVEEPDHKWMKEEDEKLDEILDIAIREFLTLMIGMFIFLYS
jgi:hypothetical protein